MLPSSTENTAGAEQKMLPRHIAIIMDGNGRWARQRGLPRRAGHAQGAETFRRIATYCRDIGIDYLTVYAFSTENWKRPAEEVEAIMGLLEKYLLESIEKMERDGIRLKIVGSIEPLSDRLKSLIAKTDEIAARLSDCFHANVCLNYGGRDEILRAAKRWSESGAEASEAAFSACLDTAGIPDPDLLIRPGGECRISNFLLWQCAYSEFVFTDKLWPDFTEEDIDAAVASFMHRDRRYGGIRT